MLTLTSVNADVRTQKGAGSPAKVVSSVPLDQDPPLSAGAMIEVQRYDSVSQTYKLILSNERIVGPNIATPDELAKAVSTLDLRKIKEHPESIVGNEYQLDKELRLLSELGVAKRKRALKPTKK